MKINVIFLRFIRSCSLFFLIGGAIGWIAGLSESPVIGIILSSLLGIIVLFFDKKEKEKREDDASIKFSFSCYMQKISFFCALLIGFVCVSTIALCVRNNGYLIGRTEKSIDETKGKINDWYTLLEYNYDYHYYYDNKIKELKQGTQNTKTIKLIDSLKKIIWIDSIQTKKYNNTLKFYITKNILEYNYGINLDIIDYEEWKKNESVSAIMKKKQQKNNPNKQSETKVGYMNKTERLHE